MDNTSRSRVERLIGSPRSAGVASFVRLPNSAGPESLQLSTGPDQDQEAGEQHGQHSQVVGDVGGARRPR
jgi:hypothetical protein